MICFWALLFWTFSQFKFLKFHKFPRKIPEKEPEQEVNKYFSPSWENAKEFLTSIGLTEFFIGQWNKTVFSPPILLHASERKEMKKVNFLFFLFGAKRKLRERESI